MGDAHCAMGMVTNYDYFLPSHGVADTRGQGDGDTIATGSQSGNDRVFHLRRQVFSSWISIELTLTRTIDN